jgi:hypothetical protein
MIPVHLFDLLRCVVLRHSDCRHEQRAAAPASVQFHRMGRFSETVFGDTDDRNAVADGFMQVGAEAAFMVRA